MALVLSRDDVQRCLSMAEAIDMMRVAFGAIYAGRAAMPQRLAVDLSQRGVALFMPSLLEADEQQILGLKAVSVVPQNLARGLPLTYASVLLLDAQTGRTLAIMEGRWLTAMRTGAASGLATDLLARRDASVLALFGAGGQAPAQVLAVHTVRPLSEVRVFNRSDEHYRQLVAELQGLLRPGCPPLRRAGSAAEALRGATLVACATTAREPLFQWSELAEGAHINAIGAFTPEMCELDAEMLAHARIVVDQREAALAEAGDLLQAQARGAIGGAESWDELGELVSGQRPGRSSAEEVTVFKSVGLGAQDAAVALHVYRRARELGVGIEVEL